MLNSKPILIRVGESSKEYHVHENMFRGNSIIFFDKVLKNE